MDRASHKHSRRTAALVPYPVVKRVLDIVFSMAVLLLLSWLLLLIAVIVKIDDPSSPVFFRQRRVSRVVDGQPECFSIIKFRTMAPNAEDLLAELQARNEKTGPVFKMKDDPRVTRPGRLLRKTSLDELPQFANVLMGDLSIVGPRPPLPSEVEQYTPKQMGRLAVKCGITCYWQTRRNRDAITFDEWVDLDLLYAEKQGFWTDFKLVVQTVGVVLTAQGT